LNDRLVLLKLSECQIVKERLCALGVLPGQPHLRPGVWVTALDTCKVVNMKQTFPSMPDKLAQVCHKLYMTCQYQINDSGLPIQEASNIPLNSQGSLVEFSVQLLRLAKEEFIAPNFVLGLASVLGGLDGSHLCSSFFGNELVPMKAVRFGLFPCPCF
jgi:hypothetical protein